MRYSLRIIIQKHRNKGIKKNRDKKYCSGV